MVQPTSSSRKMRFLYSQVSVSVAVGLVRSVRNRRDDFWLGSKHVLEIQHLVSTCVKILASWSQKILKTHRFFLYFVSLLWTSCWSTTANVSQLLTLSKYFPVFCFALDCSSWLVRPPIHPLDWRTVSLTTAWLDIVQTLSSLFWSGEEKIPAASRVRHIFCVWEYILYILYMH